MKSREEMLSYCKALLVIQIVLIVVVFLHVTGFLNLSAVNAGAILGVDCLLAVLSLIFLFKADNIRQKILTDVPVSQNGEGDMIACDKTVDAETEAAAKQELGYRYKDADLTGTKFFREEIPLDETLPKKVLIVDDNISTLKLLSAFLRKMNIDASMASSGNEAIEAVQRERYSLILIEHMMKGKDGLDTVKEIRRLKDEYYRNVPIVDVLSVGMEQYEVALDREYYQAYLTKPIDYELLLQVMVTYGLYDEE